MTETDVREDIFTTIRTRLDYLETKAKVLSQKNDEANDILLDWQIAFNGRVSMKVENEDDKKFLLDLSERTRLYVLEENQEREKS